jgi:hypothetical protein
MLGRRLVPLALLLAIAAAGCGSTSTAGPTAAPGASVAPGASAVPEQAQGGSAAPESSAPVAPSTDTPAPTAAPSAASSPIAEPSTRPSGDVGAAACSGSAENRDFFAAAAQAFTWDVYCAVLPDGWFVDTGSFRLADGGTLLVTYRGPGDTRIELQEGAYCTTGGSACSPRDHDLGTAPFGDRTGELVSLGPDVKDGFAIYVDPGAAPSWAITGTGMDRAAFEAIAAALHRVQR